MPAPQPAPQNVASELPVTRERVLDEAEALFAERGFAGTSMRDIAQRAGLTAGSLYNHFRGKDDLYAAVLERGIRPLVDRMRTLVAEGGGQAATEALVRGVMEHLGRRPHLPRLIQHEVVAGGPHVSRIARDWVRPLMAQGLEQMRRDPRQRWSAEQYPLVIAAWIQLVLGHFALAPLFREVLDEDPLAPAALARETEVLLEFARAATR